MKNSVTTYLTTNIAQEINIPYYLYKHTNIYVTQYMLYNIQMF